MSLKGSNSDPEPSLVSSVYKRIASLLPIQTGYTVAQVEMDPFFLASRYPLTGSAITLIKDIIACSCDILEEIHKNDDLLSTPLKSELSLRSILVMVKLLSDLTETNWNHQEPGKFPSTSKDYFSDSNISDGDDRTTKITYHTIQPQQIEVSIAIRAIKILTFLKPDVAIEKEICIINETAYQSKPHPHKPLIDSIDYSCNLILRYFAASNPNEYKEFVMSNLRQLKIASHKEHQLIATSQLLAFVYLDEDIFYEYLKDIWPSFGYIKRNLYQQLILSFFASGIEQCLLARPALYLQASSTSERLLTEMDAFIDYIYSQFEGTKYSRATYRVLSVLIACVPKVLEQSLLKTNKLKSSFNKKQKFIHHITKSPTASEKAEDFECIVSLYSFAAALHPLDPNHPLVRFCMAHFDSIYRAMRSHLSTAIPKGREYELKLMTELRINFYCSATILKPEVCLREIVDFIKKNQNDIKMISSSISVIRAISEMPSARKYFDIYMSELSSTFKLIMNRASHTVEETVGEMLKENTDSFTPTAETPTSASSYSTPASAFLTAGPTKTSILNKPQEISDSSITNSPFNHNYKVSIDSSSTDGSNSSKSDSRKIKLKHNKTTKLGLEINTSFYKKSNDPKYYSREVVTNILLIFSSCPYIFFSDELERKQTPIKEYYDRLSDNVKDLIVPLSIAFCDLDTKLPDAAAHFSMRMMDEEFKDQSVEYIAKSFAGSGHIVLSLCNAFLEHSLTDANLKKLYTFLVTFFERRYEMVSKYSNSDGIISQFTCHDGRCNYILSAVERTFLIALCAPDIDMYRLTKKGISIFLKERELESNHRESCFNRGTVDLFYLINDDSHIVTGLVALHKKLRKMLKSVKPTKGVIETWEYIYKRWSDLSEKDELDHTEIVEFRNYSGFLASVCGCFLAGEQVNGISSDAVILQIKIFVNKNVQLLCSDDLITRESAKDILSNEIHPSACSIVVDELTDLAESIKSKNEISNADLLLIEQVVAVICSLAEGDAHDVFLMLHNYYQPCKTIYSIVKKLDDSLNVLKLKIRFCKLGVILESRKNETGFQGALRMKNTNGRIASDWLEKAVFPESEQNDTQPNILASKFEKLSVKKLTDSKSNGISYMQLDLAVESSKCLSLLLEGLPLEASQAINEKELKRSKDMVFANYFSLFYRILEKFSSSFVQSVDTISRHKVSVITDNIILCLTNLLKSNVEVGLKYALPLGISEDHKIRVAIIQVFANIVDGLSASNIDELSDDHTIDSVSYELCKVLAGNPDFSIAVAAASPTAEVDPLASSLLSLFGYYGNMKDIFGVLIRTEINQVTRSVDILRRNSVTTRMLALFANKHGNKYLHLVLGPIIDKLYNNEDFFEVEKLSVGEEGSERNLSLFLSYLTEIVETITSSSDSVPLEFKFICSRIYETVKEKFPNSATIAVGSFMFLRFYCPCIVNPETAGIVTELPDRRLKRSLIQLAKVIQNMANGSLSSLKWPLLVSQMSKLNELNDKLFVFLGSLAKIDPNFEFSSAVEETPVADVQFLHRFLYRYWLEVRRNYLATEEWADEERMQVFSEVDSLLSKLGQPKGTFGSELPVMLKNVPEVGNQLYEFMSKYMKGDIETYMDIPIVQSSISKDGNPMVIINMYYAQVIKADAELVAFRILQIACKFWEAKYYYVIDCTGFNWDYGMVSDIIRVLSVHAPDVGKNCTKIYYYNVSQVLYPYIIEAIKVATFARLYDTRTTEINFYSAGDDPRLLSQLSLCDYSNKVLKDSRVIFNDVSLYQPEQHRFIPVTVKVGSQYVQIIFNNASKVKIGNSLKGLRLVDIYPISDITNAEISDYIGVPNELSFMVFGSKRIVLTSKKKIEIMRTIYFASSRLSQNEYDEDDVDNEGMMNFENWMGELVNLDFSGLISDDDTIRAAAFRLLGSLSRCLDLKLGGGIESVVSATFPRDNAFFVIKVSEILSKKYASTTYEFIKGFFTCYEKLSKEQKLSAIMYISPWIGNIYEYVFAADEEGGPERTSELIGMFCKISLLDRDLLPSFNTIIWNKLCLEDRISSVLLDEIVTVAIDRRAEGSDWDEIISLISLTPTVEICGQVVYRLREIIHIPKSEGESSMVAHGSWVEITVLIKICSSLFFNSIIFAEMFLPDILFIVTVFLDTGPLELRANLQKLLINVMHSFLSKDNVSDSQREMIMSAVKQVCGQRANMLFGLNRDSDDSLSGNIDGTHLSNQVTGLEIFCEILINFIGIIGDANSRSIWRVRWNAYVVDAVFREESILQSRSLLILGFLTKSGASDTLASRIIKIASEVAEQDMSDPRTLKIAISSVYSLSRLVEGLEPSSIFFTKLFWVAFSMAQVDNVISYQGALQFLGRTLSTMSKYDRFLDGTLIDALVGERYMFGKTIVTLEESHGFNVSESNIDSSLLYVITKGLHLPHTKHISFEVLKNCFEIRYKNEAKKVESGLGEIKVSCFGYLAFIFILSTTDEELESYLKQIGFKEKDYIQLDDRVRIPKVVLDFFVGGSYEAISVLLQASLYFVSNASDENSRLRYLLVYRYIIAANSRLRFLVYPDVREFLRQICATSNSLPLLTIAYDIVTDTSLSPHFSKLYEYGKIANQILDDHKVAGIRSLNLIKSQNYDATTSSKRSKLVKEILARVVSSFVETE